jgi:hypothetical protein
MRSKYILILILGLFSCQKNENKQAVEVKYNLAQRDSAALARMNAYEKDKMIASEEIKAIANIMFGISEKEFEKQKAKFMDSTKVIEMDLGNGEKIYDNSIGGYKFFTLYGQFFQKKLYSVHISGDPVQYKYYDADMPDQKRIIDEIFTKKFGPPEFNYPLKPWHTITQNQQYSSARWVVGKKIVNTNISSSGSSFTYDIDIFLPEINGIIQKEESDKQSKDLESAKDNI